MKRFLASFSLIFACLASPAHAASGDTMNFHFSPLGLIIGYYSAGLDFAVAPEWTIGPRASYLHLKWDSSEPDFSWNLTSYAVGARANWFMNGVYTSGLYVSPSLNYANTKFSWGDGTSASAGGLFAGALVGYGWFWDSFNIMLGAGAVVSLGGDKVTHTWADGTKDDYSSHNAGFDAEFSLGWTF